MADHSPAIPAVMNITLYVNIWTNPSNQNLADHVRTD